MTKILTKFICQECGTELPKWMGQCDVCKSWNSVVEEVTKKGDSKIKVADDFFKKIDFSKKDEEFCLDSEKRCVTTVNEFNRVLGGGFIEGSVILVGGPPGIGKSTLLLQILLNRISGINNYVYVSAEESIRQVSLRANRIGLSSKNQILLASTNNIEKVISSLEIFRGSSIVVIDSIQTVSTDLIHSPPGTISQIRYCTQELINIAKSNNIIVVIVGHITKEGEIAGPKMLEHMVDCVLYFEGDKSYDYRILRGSKNRYGPTDEIGVLSMTGTGLEEVANPSSVFISSQNDNVVSGVAVFSGIEGTRPILSEIQALVSNTNIAIPRRSSIGFDNNRLAMLVAVLTNRCRMSFFNKDVYLNVAGGLKIQEPAIDLAVVSSIISAYMQKPLPKGAVFFGEVSLSGEIRQSHLAYTRIKEAEKLGFTKIYCSKKTDVSGMENVIKISSIRDILEIVKES